LRVDFSDDLKLMTENKQTTDHTFNNEINHNYNELQFNNNSNKKNKIKNNVSDSQNKESNILISNISNNNTLNNFCDLAANRFDCGINENLNILKEISEKQKKINIETSNQVIDVEFDISINNKSNLDKIIISKENDNSIINELEDLKKEKNFNFINPYVNNYNNISGSESIIRNINDPVSKNIKEGKIKLLKKKL